MIPHKPFRTILLALIIASTAVTQTVYAQNAQFKIGVVNLKSIFDEYDEQKEKYKELTQEAIEADFSKYKAAVQQSQEEIDRKEKRLFELIITEIQTAVEEVGAKENYHMIFDGGKNKNNNLLYFSTTLNMTQKVIVHLNTK